MDQPARFQPPDPAHQRAALPALRSGENQRWSRRVVPPQRFPGVEKQRQVLARLEGGGKEDKALGAPEPLIYIENPTDLYITICHYEARQKIKKHRKIPTATGAVKRGKCPDIALATFTHTPPAM